MRRYGGTHRHTPALSNPSGSTPSDIASVPTTADYYTSGGTTHRSRLAERLESGLNSSLCRPGGRSYDHSLRRVGSGERPGSVVTGRADSCERHRPARSHLHVLFDPVELPFRLKSRQDLPRPRGP